MQERPSLANMFVSVSRVKPYAGTMWNAQISLRLILDHPGAELTSLSFSVLKECTVGDLTDLDLCGEEDEIESEGKTMCLVWRMSESGQLGRVYDNDSFQSAVEDHRRAYKNIVQLYIIEPKGKWIYPSDDTMHANTPSQMLCRDLSSDCTLQDISAGQGRRTDRMRQGIMKN